MKRINYNIRASFDEFVSEDTDFIIKIIKRLSIESVLEIPCANGRNLSILGPIVNRAIFADINPNMVNIVSKKIRQQNILNCTACLLDLCDLSSLFGQGIDLIMIMQQSFQMIDISKTESTLKNLYTSGVKYIILDTYDFSLNAIDQPSYLKKEIVFTDSFGQQFIRKSTVSYDNATDLVLLEHTYKGVNDVYIASVVLQNYSRIDLISRCRKAGFIVKSYYTTYDFSINKEHGRTILLLENDSIW